MIINLIKVRLCSKLVHLIITPHLWKFTSIYSPIFWILASCWPIGGVRIAIATLRSILPLFFCSRLSIRSSFSSSSLPLATDRCLTSEPTLAVFGVIGSVPNSILGWFMIFSIGLDTQITSYQCQLWDRSCHGFC